MATISTCVCVCVVDMSGTVLDTLIDSPTVAIEPAEYVVVSRTNHVEIDS